jgi:hypothetical protein
MLNCIMFMRLSKFRKKILLFLFLYVSTNTGNWVSYKLFEVIPIERNTTWINAYQYGLVFDFNPIL